MISLMFRRVYISKFEIQKCITKNIIKKIQNIPSLSYQLVRDCLNEPSNESGRVDEFGHEVDAACV
jgi:hypothetical protein